MFKTLLSQTRRKYNFYITRSGSNFIGYHPSSQLQCNLHVTMIPNTIMHELIACVLYFLITMFDVSVSFFCVVKRLASNHHDENTHRSFYQFMLCFIKKSKYKYCIFCFEGLVNKRFFSFSFLVVVVVVERVT